MARKCDLNDLFAKPPRERTKEDNWILEIVVALLQADQATQDEAMAILCGSEVPS
jgi:hypothetical protein